MNGRYYRRNDAVVALVVVTAIAFAFGLVVGRTDAATPRQANHSPIGPGHSLGFQADHSLSGAPQTDEALARVEHRVADSLRTEAGKAGGSNAARTADRPFQSGWEASGHGAPTFAVSSTGAPQSGAGDAAASSYWLRPTARDPSNGGESPRHPSALRGAETAEGGAPFPPGGSARPASPAADYEQPSASAVSVRGNPGTTAPPPETWTRQGVVNWAAESHGARYLALPVGPGHRAIVCGPSACITLVSTDAGPDLAMQRSGKIADLAVGLWEQIAGVDRRYGGFVGTWTLVP